MRRNIAECLLLFVLFLPLKTFGGPTDFHGLQSIETWVCTGIPGERVILINEDFIIREARADERGVAVLKNLAQGTWHIVDANPRSPSQRYFVITDKRDRYIPCD